MLGHKRFHPRTQYENVRNGFASICFSLTKRLRLPAFFDIALFSVLFFLIFVFL
jgi:hypothetical protein